MRNKIVAGALAAFVICALPSFTASAQGFIRCCQYIPRSCCCNCVAPPLPVAKFWNHADLT